MTAPKHKYEIELKLGLHDLDNLEYIFDVLRQDIIMHFDSTDNDFQTVSGSPNFAHSLKVEYDKDMDRDKYYELLNEYMSNKNA